MVLSQQYSVNNAVEQFSRKHCIR